MGTTPNFGLPYPASSGHVRLWEHLEALATAVDTALLALSTAGATSGGRVATAEEVTDSAAITTTETSIASIAPVLRSGAVYRLTLWTHVASTVAADTATIRIRQTSTVGTELAGDALLIASTTAIGYPFRLEVEFTAVSDGAVTFHGTLVRAGGTGSLRREAASTRATYLYADYIRG